MGSPSTDTSSACATPGTSRANFDTSQPNEFGGCSAREPSSLLVPVGVAGVRPPAVHAAEMAADGGANRLGVAHRGRVLRRDPLVGPVGRDSDAPAPGTSWAPGVRTGSPWSVCDSTGLSSASAASDQPRSHTDCQSRSGLWTRSCGSLSHSASILW